MKVCETCNREFVDDSQDQCPDDGGRLFAVMRDDTLVGRVIDGRYEILELLGQGGMGQVYRSFQISMKREIALKILPLELASDKEAVRRFLKEAQAVSRISHPNAITVYDFGQTSDGILYLAMEFIRGHALAELVYRGPLGVRETCRIMIQVCNALEEAHALGIVHRDLKPDNIMVMEKAGHKNFIKVLDFGLAKIRFGESSIDHTKSGLVCGTPQYMSPEQVMGEKVDERCDIYAAGIILYELLTGQPPFDAESPMAIAMKHLKADPPPIRTNSSRVMVPVEMQMLVLRCLAKPREQRPQSAAELRGELEAVLAAAPASPESVELPPIRTGASQVSDWGRLSLGSAERELASLNASRELLSSSDTLSFEEHQRGLSTEGASVGAMPASRPDMALSPSMEAAMRTRPGWLSAKWLIPVLLMIAVAVGLAAILRERQRPQRTSPPQTPGFEARQRPRPSHLPAPQPQPKPKTSPTRVAVNLPGKTKAVAPGIVQGPRLTTVTPRPTTVPAPVNIASVKPKAVLSPSPVEVVLRVETVPPGAELFVAGKSRGKTPCEWKVKPSAESLAVKIVKRGFKTEKREIAQLRNHVYSYRLIRKKRRKTPGGSGDKIFTP